MAFFVLRDDGVAAGCGGILSWSVRRDGELKRMFVRQQFRGRRFGELILNHLTGYARRYQVGLLRLETGIYQHAAIALYERLSALLEMPRRSGPEAPSGQA